MALTLLPTDKRAGRVQFTFDELQHSTFAVLGDDPEGPAVGFLVDEPDVEYAAHYHEADYVTVIMEGSVRIGRTWLHRGAVYVQDAGAPYGPILVGPEGLKAVVFFTRRRALVDQFPRERDRAANEELSAQATAMAETLVALGRGDTTVDDVLARFAAEQAAPD